MNPNFIDSFEASAVINPYRICKFSDAANSSKIAQGAAAADPLMGVTGKLGGGIGAMVDVFRGGVNQVTCGGNVTAGARLTSDANGKAIVTTTQGDVYIGIADQPGVLNDVIDFLFAPGVV